MVLGQLLESTAKKSVDILSGKLYACRVPSRVSIGSSESKLVDLHDEGVGMWVPMQLGETTECPNGLTQLII